MWEYIHYLEGVFVFVAQLSFSLFPFNPLEDIQKPLPPKKTNNQKYCSLERKNPPLQNTALKTLDRRIQSNPIQ